jgi:hypothetical protein
VLAGAGFFGLTWGLVRANTVGWARTEAIGTLLAGGVVVGAFLWWQQRAPSPMLSPALFRRASFTSANAVSFFMYAGLFGAVFLMSQFFQSAQHHTPLQTGVRLLPWTGAPMIIAPIAGRLAERYGNRPFMGVGLLLQAIGLAWIAAITTAGLGYSELGFALGVAGVGIAMVFPTVSTEVLASVPAEEVGDRLGHQQHPARTRGRVRRRRARLRVRPFRRLHQPSGVRRRLPRRPVGRRRLLSRRGARRRRRQPLACARARRSRCYDRSCSRRGVRRTMSSPGGHVVCIQCGEAIEESMLAVDPPSTRCRDCAKAAFDEHFAQALQVFHKNIAERLATSGGQAS